MIGLMVWILRWGVTMAGRGKHLCMPSSSKFTQNGSSRHILHAKTGQRLTFGHFRHENRRKSLVTHDLRVDKKCPVLVGGKMARGP